MKGLIQTQIQSDSQKLETETDVKFQNIIYYYWDGKKTVKQNQQVRIDFLGAVSEMEKLDYTFEKTLSAFKIVLLVNMFSLLGWDVTHGMQMFQ